MKNLKSPYESSIDKTKNKLHRHPSEKAHKLKARKGEEVTTYYQRASRFGKRYINILSEYNYSRLTPEELHYIEYQARVYGYDSTANIDEYNKYRKSKNKEFMEKFRAQQYELLTGIKYRESLDTFGENYRKALEFNGYSFMIPLFDKIWNKLSYNEREQFGSYDLPNIPIFYKVKQKAESGKKENQINATQIDSAMKELADTLLHSAIDYKIRLVNVKDIDKVLDMLGIGTKDKGVTRSVKNYLKNN